MEGWQQFDPITWQQAVARWTKIYLTSVSWGSRDWLDSVAVDYSQSGWTQAEKDQFDLEWNKDAVDWQELKEFGERNPEGIRWHAGTVVITPDYAYLTDEMGRVGDNIIIRDWFSSELLVDELRPKHRTEPPTWGQVQWYPDSSWCLKEKLDKEPCPWLIYCS